MRLIPSYKSHLASLWAQLYYGHHWISSTGPWCLQLAPDADSFSFSSAFVLLETWAGACRDGIPGHVWPIGDQGSSGRRLEWMGCLSLCVPFCGVATRLNVSLGGRYNSCPAALSTWLSPQVPVTFLVPGPLMCFNEIIAKVGTAFPVHSNLWGTALLLVVSLCPPAPYKQPIKPFQISQFNCAIPALTPTDTQVLRSLHSK